MKFLRDRAGATAIEYGLIAALLALVIVAGIGAVGTQTGTLFTRVANAFPSS